MIEPLRIALAQVNACVGDLEGNAAKVRDQVERAREAGAELVLFPELVICGYPPEDLLLKEHFLADCRDALAAVAPAADGIVALVGFPERDGGIFNSLAVLAQGELRGVYRKNALPNYGVFDEPRYFQAGRSGAVIDLGEARVGLTVCEDAWTGGPVAAGAGAGALLVVNASASPYHAGKGLERERMLAERARDNVCAVAFCNLVGGQDELVFDGHSAVVGHDGEVLARAGQFREELLFATVDLEAVAAARSRGGGTPRRAGDPLPGVDHLAGLDRSPARTAPGPAVAPPLEADAEVYAALVMGTRDYAQKNGFEHVALGLSGGIDSALVLLVAADALGPERVTAVTMPSRHSSAGTRSDAATLAGNLGVELLEIPIEPAFEALEGMLAGVFAGREPDLTEENLQARIRGNLLMALSNKFGWLVLTTGNKSEVAVGYSTLYGDSAGGFAVLKDVPKTLVYRLVDFRDGRDGDHPVPRSIVERAPSAELRPDQRDADSLPDYDTLDAILELVVERDASRAQLVEAGLPVEAIDRVLALVDRNEYKRRQQPPGIKITPRAFGRDRRMPITNRYRG